MILTKFKYLRTLFTILKGKKPTQEEIDFLESRYNLDDLEDSSSFSLNDLNDVTTSDVIAENGWVLKYDGENYKPSMIKILRSSELSINFFNEAPLSKINEQVNFKTLGTYILKVNFMFSYNSTSTDFTARLTIDNQTVTSAANGEIIRYEPKDSSGNELDGRGTNQKIPYSCVFFYQADSIGLKTVNLSFYPSGSNTSASMWDASITIEQI